MTATAGHAGRSPASGLYAQARRAATWGIGVSLGLGLVKMVGGAYGHSLALISDAIHSLIDAAISAALVGALHVAERPADREHPYGHARFEAVAGSGVAVVLVLLALGIAWEALRTIGEADRPPVWYTLPVALAGVGFQELLFRYCRRVAGRTGSAALMAAAWDYRLDALGGLIVAAGVALAGWGGPRWSWADHVAAIGVAAAVMTIGGSLLRDNIQELMDRQAPPALLDVVRAGASEVPGVLGVEKLRVRKVGLEFLVDIHVEVAPERTVREGHAVAHAVKDRLIAGPLAIRDVLVHVEPARGPIA